ncbi:MAG TPA: lipopolysaccharide transport periplasmic protein LptA [Usitatibacter sp.]|nr:lipopolysaccharide transport periplasmic protein LptA [Usitatibacter sp.]
MRTLVLPLIATLAAAPALAIADRADREKEIVIVADKWAIDDANKVSILQGNVVVTQGTMRITAEKLTVREDPQKNKFYVANGSPVTFRQKREKIEEYIDGEAQRAEFDDRTDVLKLFDRARVKSGANQITGAFITYDMQKELAEASGAAPGTAPSPNSRVKVIILPPKKGADADKGERATPLQLKPEAGTQ